MTFQEIEIAAVEAKRHISHIMFEDHWLCKEDRGRGSGELVAYEPIEQSISQKMISRTLHLNVLAQLYKNKTYGL